MEFVWDCLAWAAKYELPSVEKLKAVFEKLGLSEGSRIVIYTADWPPHAARVYSTLDYIGEADHAALRKVRCMRCMNPNLKPRCTNPLRRTPPIPVRVRASCGVAVPK